jgi:cation-transporting ATPase 13A1
LTQAKPLAKLSDFAPACSVFQGSVLGSILGQFVIHFSCLFAVLRLCQSEYALPTDAIVGSAELTELGTTWTQVAKPIADSRFTPDIINTAMFLLSGTISMNNFLVNYRGHPFSQNIRENKLLFRVSCAVYCVIVILVLELFEPFSDLLQLVAMPSQEFQYMLGGLLILDLVACWGVEKFCQIFERRG